MVAKAILFKKAHALVRPMFQQAQANVAAYVVSLVANRLGPKLDLDKIWLRQDISAELKTQIQTWAAEVNKVLHDSVVHRTGADDSRGAQLSKDGSAGCLIRHQVPDPERII